MSFGGLKKRDGCHIACKERVAQAVHRIGTMQQHCAPTQKRHPPVLLHEGTPLSWVAGVYRYSIDKTVVHAPGIVAVHNQT